MQQKKRGYQESDAPYLTRLSAMDACGRRSGVNVIRGQRNTAQVQKIISADGIFDDSNRKCTVHKYDLEEDYIYLELKEDDLRAILLDAKYRCYISTKSELLYCTGVVKERYRSEDKNLLKFRIENGFYNVYEGRRMSNL